MKNTEILGVQRLPYEKQSRNTSLVDVLVEVEHNFKKISECPLNGHREKIREIFGERTTNFELAYNMVRAQDELKEALSKFAASVAAYIADFEPSEEEVEVAF